MGQGWSGHGLVEAGVDGLGCIHLPLESGGQEWQARSHDKVMNKVNRGILYRALFFILRARKKSANITCLLEFNLDLQVKIRF